MNKQYTFEEYRTDIILLWSKINKDERFSFKQYVKLNQQLKQIEKTLKECIDNPEGKFLPYNNGERSE